MTYLLVVIVLILVGLVIRSAARKRKDRRHSGVPTPIPYVPSVVPSTTQIPLTSSHREDNEQNINATIYRSLQNYTDKVQNYSLNSPKEYPYLLPPSDQQPISFPDPNGTYTSSLNIQNLI